MDNEPRAADDLPDEAELSGPVRDAIEQVRRQEPSDAMLARVLERARQIRPPAQSGPADPLPTDNDRSLPEEKSHVYVRNSRACRGHRGRGPDRRLALQPGIVHGGCRSGRGADQDVGRQEPGTQGHAGRQDRRGLGPWPETPPQPARRHLPDRPRRQIVARRREGESGQRADLLALSAARPAASTCWPCSIFPRTALATSRRNCWRPGRPSMRPATAARWKSIAGRPPDRMARCGSMPWSMPRPSCCSRSKACGSAASGPSRSASWRSSPATNRSTKTCSSWAIRSPKTAASAR